jgi:hypothetical protein
MVTRSRVPRETLRHRRHATLPLDDRASASRVASSSPVGLRLRRSWRLEGRRPSLGEERRAAREPCCVPKTCPQLSQGRGRPDRKCRFSRDCRNCLPRRPRRAPLFQGGAPLSRATLRFAGALPVTRDLERLSCCCTEVLYATNQTTGLANLQVFPLRKPSDGLEPSTPSLPWRCSTN